MKNLIVAIIFVAFLTNISTVFAETIVYDGEEHEYDVPEIHLMVNNKEITDLPESPLILFDRVYVPVREMFEAMGATVAWDGDFGRVLISYGENLIIFKIDNMFVDVNGTMAEIPVPAKIVNSKTMIPVRFASEFLGFIVEWNDVERAVYITEPDEPSIIYVPSSYIPEEEAVPENNDVYEFLGPDVSELASDVSKTDVTAGNITENDFLYMEDFLALESKVTNVITEQNSDLYTYKIISDSPICGVNKLILTGNRLVVDVYNSQWCLDNPNYEIDDLYLKSIRSSQFQDEPVKITRIVFDLIKPLCFDVSISEDRCEIIVSFIPNSVNDISFTVDFETGCDIIKIDCDETPSATISQLSSPERLLIDFPLYTINSDLNIENCGGYFAQNVRVEQFESETARVIVDLSEPITYDWLIAENSIIVRIMKAPARNYTFSSDNMVMTINKTSEIMFNINDVKHDDRYYEYKYVLTLPGDFTEHIGLGSQSIKDEYINSIDIKTVDGQTQITFNEARILAFALTEDGENIYINAMLPQEKYDNIIVIDPGHGGEMKGSLGVDGVGLVEKELTLDVGLRLIALLDEDPRIKVYSTRVTDVNPSFDERVDLGNELGDLFVSLHYNAFTTALSNGLETYWHKHDIPHNYQSKSVAEIIQKNIVADLKLDDRRVKEADFYVIKYSNVPAVLVEMGFITNPKEAEKISDPAFRQLTAESLYRSIAEIFSEYKPSR